jgi:hypothetical protein
MAILGLTTTTALTTNRANNARRKVFYDYPTGKFPLTGLLSLVDVTEELADYEMKWYEETWKSARDLTVLTEAAKGPFATNANGGTAAANATQAAGATIYVQLVLADDIRVRDVIRLKDIELTNGTKTDVTIWVTAVNTTSKVITAKVLDPGLLSATAWTNSGSTANNGKQATVIGTAAGEGDRSRSDGRSTDPIAISNYTQIFRTVLGPWTGSALKMGQNWDSNPKYKKDVKDGLLRHMVGLERSLLLGTRTNGTTVNADGDTVPMRTAGGLLWFLRQWDKGNTTNGGSFDYRPGGADLTSADWTNIDYEDKRVIKNIGSITKGQWLELTRRMFASVSDTGFEKLLVCGDRFMAVINAYADKNNIRMEGLDSSKDTYGIPGIKRLETGHGDLLIKTHPLFKEDPGLQTTAVVIDMGDLEYHNMEGRDTELLANRQPRDADYRKDEIITEATYEIRTPRHHMWLEGLTSITA